jgi:hypothetical protein
MQLMIGTFVQAAGDRRPVRAVPRATGEQAGWRCILDLYEAVCLLAPIARDDIGNKLAVEPHLDPEAVARGGTGVVRREESAKMVMHVEEREDVVAL